MSRVTMSSAEKTTKKQLTRISLSQRSHTETVVFHVESGRREQDEFRYQVKKAVSRKALRPEWRDSEYRQGYMEAAVEQGVAWQLKINREARGISQVEMARLLGTKQSAVSRMEDPSYGVHNLETLKKAAAVFDCALLVRFVSYSVLGREAECLSPGELYAESYSEEAAVVLDNLKGMVYVR